MRLELKPAQSGSAAAARASKWYFEKGRRTLGRSPDCDWQLPEDQRSISKLHCTIESDAQGFILRDQSANGSRVDGVVVHEGETARLSDQSRLEVGGLAFMVQITGEAHRDLEDPDTSYAVSDEPLTISAILADIAPGGRTASGVLGNKVSEDWLEPIAKREGPSPSRNVDIGWNGPPDVGSSKLLPDDWNLDEGPKDNYDYSNQIEHGSATHVSIPVSRVRSSEPRSADILRLEPPQAEAPPQPPTEISRQPETVTETPRPQASAPARASDTDTDEKLAPLLSRLEDSLEASFAAFGLDLPPSEASPDFFNAGRENTLISRAEDLLARQIRLQAALENLVHHAGQAMEPRIIESRIDAAAGSMKSFGFLRGRDYWLAYKDQFEKNGTTLSVQDVFRDAMTRSEGDEPQGAVAQAEREDRDNEK